MKASRLALLCTLPLCLLSAQQTKTHENSTSGACSPIAPDNHGIINIECPETTLTPEDRKLLGDVRKALNGWTQSQGGRVPPELVQQLNTILTAQQDIREKLSDLEALAGKLQAQQHRESPTFSEQIDTAVFKLGSNSATYSIEALRRVSVRPFNLLGFTPLLHVEGERLFVDVALWRSRNEPAVLLIHDKLENRPPDWDMNSTNQALEVVDQKQNPVFQLIYERPSRVSIKGIFHLPNGGVVSIGDDGDVAVDSGGYIPATFHISRLFK